MIYGQFADYGNIAKGLEGLGHEIVESGFEYIPTQRKSWTKHRPRTRKTH